MLSRVPSIFKNKYALTAFAFVVWMLFFDRHDFFSQVHNRNAVNELKDDKLYLLDEIEESKKNTVELMTNPKNLEKFARENYFMKREKEEIFIIQFEKEDKGN